MKNFILNLQFIFKPSWWIMNKPFNQDMDDIMNYLLDKYEFSNIDEYTAYLGSNEIWIANRPYATMVLRYSQNSCRASRLTILRGLNKLGVHNVPRKEEEIRKLRNSIIK